MSQSWIVNVQNGQISGVPEKNGAVTSFKGIPYASPPVGDLRWRPPQPPLSWDGIRAMDHYGPSPLQHPQTGFFRREFFSEPLTTSEDCLYLNVWTPAHSSEDKLPVFIWIHGGGLEWWSGSSVPFDGANLAELNIVVVTINYRLGIFGLFAHPLLSKESPYGVSGNYALHDQIEAIKWVHENIRAFGGDPDNITIGGESGGSRSVAIHMVSSLSKGLFQKAIMQSGSAVGGWALDYSLTDGEKTGIAFADKLGAETIDELRRIPGRELLARYMPAQTGLRFFSYIDGYVYHDEPGRIFQNGGEHKVPLLNGNTQHEGVHDYSKATTEWYTEKIQQQYGIDANAYFLCYPGRNREEVIRSLSAASSDNYYVGHRIMSCFHHKATGQNVYQYLFTKVPPGCESEHYGAFHTGEIAYIFRNLDFIDRPWIKSDYEFSDMIAQYWANFIRTGNPNGAGLSIWEPCVNKADPIMILGDNTGMSPMPNVNRMTFIAQRYSRWLEDKSRKAKL